MAGRGRGVAEAGDRGAGDARTRSDDRAPRQPAQARRQVPGAGTNTKQATAIPTIAEAPSGPPRCGARQDVERDAERGGEDPRLPVAGSCPAHNAAARPTAATAISSGSRAMARATPAATAGDPPRGAASRSATIERDADADEQRVGQRVTGRRSRAGDRERGPARTAARSRPAGAAAVARIGQVPVRRGHPRQLVRPGCRRRRVTTSRPAPATTAPPAIMTSVPASEPVSGSWPVGRWTPCGVDSLCPGSRPARCSRRHVRRVVAGGDRAPGEAGGDDGGSDDELPGRHGRFPLWSGGLDRTYRRGAELGTPGGDNTGFPGSRYVDSRGGVPIPVDPAGARPGHGAQPHRLLGPPDELRPRRAADRAARRLLRRAGRRRGRADRHRGALDAPDGLALREADPRVPPRRHPRATGGSPRPSTATACRSSPRSTTTAARRRRCTRGCRCGRRRPSPTRCSGRSPRR